MQMLSSMFNLILLLTTLIYCLGVVLTLVAINALNSKPENTKERAIYALCLIFWPVAVTYFCIIVYKSKRKLKRKSK